MAQISYGTITITDTTDLEWFYGTDLTHTSDSVELTGNAQINGAAIGSMYLNTQTSIVYKFTAIGNNGGQVWTYVGNLSDGVIDNIEVGGTNLLRTQLVGKNIIIRNSSYRFADIPLTQPLKVGQTYTLQLWGVTLDQNSTGVGVYWGSETNNIGSTSGANSLIPDENGYIIKTFTITTAQANHQNSSNLMLYLYNYPSNRNNYNTTITKWKLEEGNIATSWSPAPEDVDMAISDASKVATNYLAVDETGIMIAELSDSEETPSTATTKNVFIDSNSVDVRDGQTILASFGESTIIGKANQSRIEFSSNELTGYGNHGQELFRLSGNGGESDNQIYHEQMIYYDDAQNFPYNNEQSLSHSLTYLPAASQQMLLIFAPEAHDYESQQSEVQYFYEVDANDQQQAGTIVGRFCALIGRGMEGDFTQDFYAHFCPQGYSYGGGITHYTISFHYDKNTGTFSNIKASSQIEFNRYADDVATNPNNYPEFDTTLDPTVSALLKVYVKYISGEPTPAFSFGSENNTRYMGAYSTMMGVGLQASGDNQVVIGRYNEEIGDALFLIGNGSGMDSRSNILEVVNYNSGHFLRLNGELFVSDGIINYDKAEIQKDLIVGDTGVNQTRYLDLVNATTQVSFASNPNGNYGLYNKTIVNNTPINKWSIVANQNHDVYIPNGDLYASKALYIQGKKMIYEAGDIINCFGLRCAGLLTNSGKNIEFFIPLSKPVASNLKASISGNWAIRHVGGGYLLNSATLASIGTVTITIVDLGIYVTVVASTVFSATNNTPVVVSATGNAAGTATGNSKITFSTQ